MAQRCPFIKECALADLGPLGPDQAELMANTSSFLLDSIQTRKSAGRATPVAAVPAGLEPHEHFYAGLAATSPLAEEPTIPEDLEWAVKKTVEMGADIDSWREEQFKTLEQAIKSDGGHGQNPDALQPRAPQCWPRAAQSGSPDSLPSGWR